MCRFIFQLRRSEIPSMVPESHAKRLSPEPPLTLHSRSRYANKASRPKWNEHLPWDKHHTTSKHTPQTAISKPPTTISLSKHPRKTAAHPPRRRSSRPISIQNRIPHAYSWRHLQDQHHHLTKNSHGVVSSTILTVMLSASIRHRIRVNINTAVCVPGR
jgi:hypothetical protein